MSVGGEEGGPNYHVRAMPRCRFGMPRSAAFLTRVLLGGLYQCRTRTWENVRFPRIWRVVDDACSRARHYLALPLGIDSAGRIQALLFEVPRPVTGEGCHNWLDGTSSSRIPSMTLGYAPPLLNTHAPKCLPTRPPCLRFGLRQHHHHLPSPSRKVVTHPHPQARRH